MRPLRMIFGLVVLATTVGGAIMSTASCASIPDDKRFTAVLSPDFNTFHDSVDPYIEKYCGTLDCHGQPGRGFRVYGFRGLRLYSQEAGLIPGLQITTEEEKSANFYALIAVEPEEMSRVIARNGDNPDQLLLLRKATGSERHKGGTLMSKGSQPYNCITAWLRLPPNQGQKLSTTDQAYCDFANMLP